MIAQELAIYRDASKLLELAMKVQAQVPRSYRLAVGQRIAEECSHIVVLIARANRAMGAARADRVGELIERLEAATLMLKIGHDLRVISRNAWASSIELTSSIGKQAQGWLNHTRNSLLQTAPAA